MGHPLIKCMLANGFSLLIYKNLGFLGFSNIVGSHPSISATSRTLRHLCSSHLLHPCGIELFKSFFLPSVLLCSEHTQGVTNSDTC
jgi:hypothetical protein